MFLPILDWGKKRQKRCLLGMLLLELIPPFLLSRMAGGREGTWPGYLGARIMADLRGGSPWPFLSFAISKTRINAHSFVAPKHPRVTLGLRLLVFLYIGVLHRSGKERFLFTCDHTHISPQVPRLCFYRDTFQNKEKSIPVVQTQLNSNRVMVLFLVMQVVTYGKSLLLWSYDHYVFPQ